MTKPKAYHLVFDGLADWETGLALCEINKSGRFEVITVGFTKAPVKTMGGLTILPDIALEEVDPEQAAIFILPGGDRWEQATDAADDALTMLLHQLHERRVVIAAICGATLAIIRARLVHNTLHTSNARPYVEAQIADYDAGARYREQLAVRDNAIITASGAGSVEFAHEIIKQLNLYSEADTQVWFDLFKHGVMPPAASSQEENNR